MFHFYASKRTTAGLSVMIALALSAGSAMAKDTIYKQIMPDGRIVYTDKPSKQAKTEKTIQVEAPAGQTWSTANGVPPGIHMGGRSLIPQPGQPGSVISAPNMPALPGQSIQPKADAGKDEAKSKIEQAEKQLKAAEERLEKARQAKAEGEVSGEGERTRNANGSFRPNEKYFERQAALDQAVKEAQQHLEASQKALRDLQ